MILHPGLGHGAATARAQRTGGMGLVDHHAGVVGLGELDDLQQRGDVAVHREHAVGDDQRAPAARLLEAPGQMLHVGVVVDEGLGPGEPAAVHQRGVVERVGEHDLALTGERRHDPRVGEIAGAEQHARLPALEVREALLEAAVDGHVPGDQPRRAGARAPAHRSVGRSLAHARVVGQPEVVVRAQQQDRLAVEDHARALRARDLARPAVQAELLELVEAILDVHHWMLLPPRPGAGAVFGAPSGRDGT